MIIKNSSGLRQIIGGPTLPRPRFTSGRFLPFALFVFGDGPGLGHAHFSWTLKGGLVVNYDSPVVDINIATFLVVQASSVPPSVNGSLYGGEFYNCCMRNSFPWSKT
jgi:hypothetical protein